MRDVISFTHGRHLWTTSHSLVPPARSDRQPGTRPGLPRAKPKDRQPQHRSNSPAMRSVAVLRYGNRLGPHPMRSCTRPVRSAGLATGGTGELPGTFAPQCHLVVQLSTQTKGRVERNHGTHQDRLIKKLRRQNLCSYEAANHFLREIYLPEHNQRYGRPAASEEDFHRPKPSLRRLEEIFCLETQRALSNDWVVRYGGRLLQIQRHSYHHTPVRAKVVVQEWETGKLEIRYRGQKIAWKEIAALPERPLPETLRERLRPPRPPATHPWRRNYRDMPTQRRSAQW